MSNHSGGRMLNEVLQLLHNRKIFDLIGKDETQELTELIVEIGEDYDCNTHEILSDMSDIVKVCSGCGTKSDVIIDNFCQNCYEKNQ